MRGISIAALAAAGTLGTPAMAADVSLPQGFAMQPRAQVDVQPSPGTPAAVAAAVRPPLSFASPPPASAVPLAAQLTATQRTDYRAIFAAIRSQAWSDAAARLDAMAPGPLHPIARAELFLARGSPKVALDPLVQLVGTAPWMPQAAQLARLASARGATDLPLLPSARSLVRLSGAPKRQAARPTRSDAAASALAARVVPLIKDDLPAEAEALLQAAAPELSADALTEWQQRIAWSYFLTGDDANARRLTATAEAGFGEWAVQADWVAGLAAWRQQDCAAAGKAFDAVASRARDAEMTAAGLFWSGRADMACGRPERIQPKLRSAARLSETFYGLLAGAALGRRMPAAPSIDVAGRDWPAIAKCPALTAAIALHEIGEDELAGALIRHQAAIGLSADHETLVHLAARLDLPNTQIWLAQNGPAGVSLTHAARYPTPGWAPQGGWRVDKSLMMAHALQESQFRTAAVSPAGARGLLQIMPGTADLIARRSGETVDRARLTEPALNLEYGQRYFEQLRDTSMTGGLLPKVIAAYNAGPGSVAKWNERGRNLADPLLFIEAIPFVETRAYVAIVLRNYWMYEQQAGRTSGSLRAMAQGLWPKFPGLPGATALRLTPLGAVASVE